MVEYIIDVPDNIKRVKSSEVDVPAMLMGLPLREEIIRCRDCKWFRANATPYDPDGRYDFCTQFGFDFKGSDGFCAWAERREADHG